ncbi:MAG: DNA repair protein RecO [Pseudomonadota bacterium]
MSRCELESAWVLHHHPYRDSSLLLELLTANHGRVGVIARGARSARSKSRGLLQPFQSLLVSWAGRGELGTLATVERDRASPRLPPAQLMAGFYVNELLLKLLQRQDPHPEVFDDYQVVIRSLASAGDDQSAARALRLFEKRLLDALGYGLNLTHEGLSGRPVQGGCDYHYYAESGPEPAGVAEGATVVSGEALLALAAERLEEAQHLQVARQLLSEALQRQLGGRALRTREVAKATVRRRRTSAASSTAER